MPKGAKLITKGEEISLARDIKNRIGKFKRSIGFHNPTRVGKIADVRIGKYQGRAW